MLQTLDPSCRLSRLHTRLRKGPFKGLVVESKTADMSRPFHSDARFLSLDGERCVLRFMITLVVGLVASVNSVTVASAQTYPQRAVKFILPFGPAAGTDITARLLAEK